MASATPAELIALVERIISDPIVQQAVLPALEAVWKNFGAPKVAHGYAHVLYKALDASIGAVVQHVPDAAQAKALVDGLIAHARSAATQVGDAAEAYAPFQLDVELAKAQKGVASAETAAARAKRKAWINSQS